MKNELANSQNNRFLKFQELLKPYLSIIMGKVEEESQKEQNLTDFEQTATSPEDVKQIEILKESLESLNREAKEYESLVGICTSKKSKNTNHSKTITSKTTSTPSIQNTILETPEKTVNVSHTIIEQDER